MHSAINFQNLHPIKIYRNEFKEFISKQTLSLLLFFFIQDLTKNIFCTVQHSIIQNNSKNIWQKI